jgi:hypothetical protein
VVSDLNRIILEDETARAGVQRSAAAARERIEAEQKRLEADRDERLRLLLEKVDVAVARLLADAERDVAERRGHRRRWLKEQASRLDALAEPGAMTVVTILRDRPRKKTL